MPPWSSKPWFERYAIRSAALKLDKRSDVMFVNIIEEERLCARRQRGRVAETDCRPRDVPCSLMLAACSSTTSHACPNPMQLEAPNSAVERTIAASMHGSCDHDHMVSAVDYAVCMHQVTDRWSQLSVKGCCTSQSSSQSCHNSNDAPPCIPHKSQLEA